MAAATVTGKQAGEAVFGNLRRIGFNSIAFANNGDTWTVKGVKNVFEINLVPTTLPPGTYYFTVSGNVITLVSASGGITFTGGIVGL